MKKLILPLSIAVTIGITSCGVDALSIEVENLETPCDCLDGLFVVGEELVEILGDNRKPPKNQKADYKKLLYKFSEIENYCSKIYDKDEMEECSSFEEADEFFRKNHF